MGGVVEIVIEPVTARAPILRREVFEMFNALWFTARKINPRSLFVAGLAAVCLVGSVSIAHAQSEPPSEPPADWGPTAIDYSNVPYPQPVSYFDVSLKGQDYRMAYMDVAPVGPPNGQVVVLFHGMNFFAAAFELTIEALRNEGFRVIAVDRLGFGRSSKPDIHYNLHMPARHTKQLLDALGIGRTAILGHSMGGMVATRFASHLSGDDDTRRHGQSDRFDRYPPRPRVD